MSNNLWLGSSVDDYWMSCVFLWHNIESNCLVDAVKSHRVNRVSRLLRESLASPSDSTPARWKQSNPTELTEWAGLYWLSVIKRLTCSLQRLQNTYQNQPRRWAWWAYPAPRRFLSSPILSSPVLSSEPEEALEYPSQPEEASEYPRQPEEASEYLHHQQPSILTL